MRPRTRCFSLSQVVAGGLEQRGVLELGLTPVVGKEHLQVCKWTTLLEPVILKVLEYILPKCNHVHICQRQIPTVPLLHVSNDFIDHSPRYLIQVLFHMVNLIFEMHYFPLHQILFNSENRTLFQRKDK